LNQAKKRNLKKPARKDIETVKRCHRAYERFVMTGAIALGLLQLISLNLNNRFGAAMQGF
jgi:hypothetical protein